MLASLNARLAALLQELAQVAGTQSIFVCDNQGHVLGAMVNSPADLAVYVVKTKRITDRMGLAVAQCLALIGQSPKDMEMRFDNQSLFVHDMRNAFIVIVMNQDTNPSLLRMELNVATHAFENDAELNRHLQTAIPLRASVLNANAMEPAVWQLVEKAKLSPSK